MSAPLAQCVGVVAFLVGGGLVVWSGLVPMTWRATLALAIGGAFMVAAFVIYPHG